MSWTISPAEVPPSDEQQELLDRAQMRNRDLFNRFKRLLAELSPDDLQVLHATYSGINGAAANAASLANWYEGMCLGAIYVRDLRLGEQLTEETERLYAPGSAGDS